MTKTRATLMTKAGALESAQDLQVSVPGDYSFVRRFRFRRLLTFLWLQGCSSTFFAMLKQTSMYFCVDYLARFVCKGQWTEALDYIVPRFLRPVPQSMEARLLVRFLLLPASFIPAGGGQASPRKQLRVDMRPVWAKAAGIVRDLASRAPEFRNRLLLPAGPMGPQNVLPIGFGFAPFRRRRHVKKHRAPQSSAIAKLYLNKRRTSLRLSSSHSNQELSPDEFVAKAVDWFQSIMKESLEVLICPPALELNQGCALQSSEREGTPVTGNVINPECSSVPLTIGEGGAAISQSQNMLGAMACPATSFEVISAAKDGTPILHIMEGENVGAAGHPPPAPSNQDR